MRRRGAAAALAALLALAACGPRRGGLPRELVRLGPAPGADAACAQRLRDPRTGREYQLRSMEGDGTRVTAAGGGPGAFPAAFNVVGAYAPASAEGGLAGPPLRVECRTLRVVGVAGA